MSSSWIEALALILSPLSVTAVVLFFGRSTVSQLLNRNLENYKSALAASSAREIESLKAELRRIAREHDIVFERLHADRAAVIKSLYQRVRDLSRTAKRYAEREGVTTAEDHDANRKSVEATATALSQEMLDARIFLPEELCAKIQTDMHDVIGFATNIAGEWFPPIRTPEKQFTLSIENKNKLNEAAWHLETEIADEFRKLFGVA